ncbi:MAG: hypothetical protein J3Q66DRAFT_437699 [Benniella sp.]|nr:MAG: hypothetical protein J3Q66DRAFT_437699 [Benniella sp.]
MLGETDMPFPPLTLPYDITKTFEASELQEISSVWQELSLHEWTAFIVKKPDFETSPEFAEKVLHVLSGGWNEVSENSQEIVAHLANKKCIPTKYGMKIPNESYFDTVDLFPDLPFMVFTKQPLEKLLLDIGARQSVEIQLMFDRLVDTGSWDHIRLVKYLVSVRDKLSPNDIKDLQSRSIFPRADQPTVPSTQPVNRHLASTLYAPTETHINLELPVIEWESDWNERSDEAGILFDLGLGKEPRMMDLLERTAPSYKQATRDEARQFFVSNFERLYRDQYNASSDMAFLPTTCGSVQTRLGCFWNEACGVMGFPILEEDWRNYATLLGIQENPSPEILLDTLSKSPPTSRDKARQVFEYLFSVQAKFQDEHWTKLKTEKFIPLDDTGESLADPQSCYFYREDLPYRDLLATVNFGSSANRFLKACGVKEEPKPIDLAQLVARSPEKFLRHEGVNGYMSILRQIATHLDVIKVNESLLDEMKKSPFLLGEQRVSQDDDAATFPKKTMADGGKSADFIHSEQDENTGQIVHYKLDHAVKIYLVDDTLLQQIFTPFCAPMEDLLETLYESLGSTPISKQEKYLKFNQSWMETELKVRQLPELRVHRKFLPTGVTKSQGTTACIVQDRIKVHYLLISAQEEMDYFDIADALAKLLLKKNKKKKLNDTFMWSNLLSSSLESQA